MIPSTVDQVARVSIGKSPSAASWPTLTQAWQRHSYILPSLLFSLAVCAWFVTWGDW